MSNEIVLWIHAVNFIMCFMVDLMVLQMMIEEVSKNITYYGLFLITYNAESVVFPFLLNVSLSSSQLVINYKAEKMQLQC